MKLFCVNLNFILIQLCFEWNSSVFWPLSGFFRRNFLSDSGYVTACSRVVHELHVAGIVLDEWSADPSDFMTLEKWLAVLVLRRLDHRLLDLFQINLVLCLVELLWLRVVLAPEFRCDWHSIDVRPKCFEMQKITSPVLLLDFFLQKRVGKIFTGHNRLFKRARANRKKLPNIGIDGKRLNSRLCSFNIEQTRSEFSGVFVEHGSCFRNAFVM